MKKAKNVLKLAPVHSDSAGEISSRYSPLHSVQLSPHDPPVQVMIMQKERMVDMASDTENRRRKYGMKSEIMGGAASLAGGPPAPTTRLTEATDAVITSPDIFAVQPCFERVRRSQTLPLDKVYADSLSWKRENRKPISRNARKKQLMIRPALNREDSPCTGLGEDLDYTPFQQYISFALPESLQEFPEDFDEEAHITEDGNPYMMFMPLENELAATATTTMKSAASMEKRIRRTRFEEDKDSEPEHHMLETSNATDSTAAAASHRRRPTRTFFGSSGLASAISRAERLNRRGRGKTAFLGEPLRVSLRRRRHGPDIRLTLLASRRLYLSGFLNADGSKRGDSNGTTPFLNAQNSSFWQPFKNTVMGSCARRPGRRQSEVSSLKRRFERATAFELRREVAHGCYPFCTHATLVWVTILGSLLFLAVGAWLVVENESNIECRLSYEDEALQEGGSHYSLLSITSDMCSGRVLSKPYSSSSSARRGSRSRRRKTASSEAAAAATEFASTQRFVSGSGGRSYTVGGNDSGRKGGIGSQFFDYYERGLGPRIRRAGRRHALGIDDSPFGLFHGRAPTIPDTGPYGSVTELPGPYIYVYVELENFFQDDAQVLWSRKDEQLAGEIFTNPLDLKECEPIVTARVENVTKVLHPCGVLAWNVFTDRFQFFDAVPDDTFESGGPARPLHIEQGPDILLSSLGDWQERFKNPTPQQRAKYRDKVYFWMSVADNDDGKEMFKTREESRAELLMDHLNYKEAGKMVENGHFIQWMHPSAFGTWRKLYGRIRGPLTLPLFAYIAVAYDVKLWRGRKTVVLVQFSRFGGSTLFLGIAYLVFGCLLAMIAVYMIWRRYFCLPEYDIPMRKGKSYRRHSYRDSRDYD